MAAQYTQYAHVSNTRLLICSTFLCQIRYIQQDKRTDRKQQRLIGWQRLPMTINIMWLSYLAAMPRCGMLSKQ